MEVPSGNLLHSYRKIHHFQWENPLCLWPLSSSLCLFTRVYMIFLNSKYIPNIFLIYSKYIPKSMILPKMWKHKNMLQSPTDSAMLRSQREIERWVKFAHNSNGYGWEFPMGKILHWDDYSGKSYNIGMHFPKKWMIYSGKSKKKLE